ncbi:flagellar motor switch protein FliG [Spirochaetia bacterium]|nr:flagellar motor switch protein FliG [Spirochaetia bacterium]
MGAYQQRKLDAYKRASAGNGIASDGNKQSSWLEKTQSFAKIPRFFPKDDESEQEKESKYRKVAKFLILIGEEQASKVLANLDEKQIERIMLEIAGIKGITAEEAVEVFAEFQGLVAGTSSYGAYGGPEEARKLLYAAFGPEKGEAFLRRAVPSIKETSFSFLEDYTGEQIAMLLHDESPATGAMILSRIDPKVSALALKHSEPLWRLETVRRIGHIGQVSPEVLEKTAAALREKVHSIGSGQTSDVDGMGALAAILKHADISFGDKILNDLGDQDPDLSKNLKERLYTLDDVVRADDKPIQEKLHSMSVKDIAVLIKGREEAFSEKVLSNISRGRRLEVRDEISFMGAVPKKDVDAAIKEFMGWFRREREAGHILLSGDELVE